MEYFDKNFAFELYSYGLQKVNENVESERRRRTLFNDFAFTYFAIRGIYFE